MAVYDTMQYIRSPVSTVCIGQAASMGSLLLAAGAKGKRFALPNANIMIHQPSGGAQGQATDIEIQAREILRLRARLNEIYVKHTGQALETIVNAVERDRFLTPNEAKEFGRGLDTLQNIMRDAERSLGNNPVVNGTNVRRDRPKSAKDPTACGKVFRSIVVRAGCRPTRICCSTTMATARSPTSQIDPESLESPPGIR